jgi:Ca-activated chloride channel family protein
MGEAMSTTLKTASRILCLVGLPLAVATGGARAHPDAEGSHQAPYFLLPGNGSDPARFPLKETTAAVDVAGVVAHVRVTQVYQNQGRTPLEAIYVFPGSTHAAVSGLRMTVGERTVVAKIHERGQARAQYQDAKRAGQTASLLEQHRPNVFQVSVSNIMPGEEVQVDLDYTELLVPEEGVYEFVFPAVVGPRYRNPAAPVETWVANPFLPPGERNPTRWDLTVRLDAGTLLGEVASPSHAVGVQFSGPRVAEVVLDGKEEDPGNRDFVLRYRLAGEVTSSSLLLYPGEEEGFFLLTVQPPARVSSQDVVPREYVFVLDVSGSMAGFPLETAKGVVRRLLDGMRVQDRFNVVLFAGGSTVLAERSLSATLENLARAWRVVDQEHGGGSTELVPALKRAMDLPREAGASRCIVLLTDGYVSADTEALDLVRDRLGEANVFVFGVGTAVNRHLVEGLARAGQGESFVVTRAAEGERQAGRFQRYVSAPVLTGVEVSFQGFEVHDVDPPRLPDLLAERPVVLVGKYSGEPRGVITVTGHAGATPFQATVDVGEHEPDKRNAALRQLWARRRADSLADRQVMHDDKQRREEITALGLKYGLLTAHTSFLAVDSRVRNRQGHGVTVVQPLPLPQGVSPGAVSSMGYGTGMGGGGVGGMGRGMGGGGSAGLAQARVRSSAASGVVGGLESGGGLPLVQGAMDKEGIGRVLRRHLVQVRACYEQQLLKQPGLAGKVTVTFVIGRDGRVKSCRVKESTLQDAQVEGCLTRVLGRARFPAPAGGGEVQVSYPFTFQPPAPGKP